MNVELRVALADLLKREGYPVFNEFDGSLITVPDDFGSLVLHLSRNNCNLAFELCNCFNRGSEEGVKLCESFGLPVFQFQTKAFLSWFRGHYVQVSTTLGGEGEKGRSANSMESDIKLAAILPKKLSGLIFFSHVLEAGMQIKEFRRSVFSQQEVFNLFMQQCGKKVKTETEEFVLENAMSVLQSGSTRQVIYDISFAEDHIAIVDFDGLKHFAHFPVWSAEFRISKKDYYSLMYRRLFFLLLFKMDVMVDTSSFLYKDERITFRFESETIINRAAYERCVSTLADKIEKERKSLFGFFSNSRKISAF